MLKSYYLPLLFNIFGSCLIFWVLHCFLKVLSNIQRLCTVCWGFVLSRILTSIYIPKVPRPTMEESEGTKVSPRSVTRLYIYIYIYACHIEKCNRLLKANQPPSVLAASVAAVLPSIDCLVSTYRAQEGGHHRGIGRAI